LHLARETETCSLTIKRRAARLTERGLVRRDDVKRLSITDEGRKALGDAAPKRWVDLDRVRASTAKDVLTRSPTNDRTAAQLAENARMARGRPRGGKHALMRAMAV
jgi:hypothetical protein